MADNADAVSEKRKSQYSSRLSRARTANMEKRGLTRFGGGSPSADMSSMANVAFSIPVQSEVDVATQEVANMAISGTSSNRPPPKAAVELKSEASIFCKPEDEQSIVAEQPTKRGAEP